MFKRLFVLILLAAATISVSAPVHAATDPVVTTSCSGASCNGVDPYTTTCINDMVVVGYAQAQGTGVWRLYSPSCNAYYAEGYGQHPYYDVMVYMQDNWQATFGLSGGGAHSKMWASGLGCVYYSQFSSGACA